jgi:hypothetical protein
MRSLRHFAKGRCLCCLGVMHKCNASLLMHVSEVCSACGRLSTSRPRKLVLPRSAHCPAARMALPYVCMGEVLPGAHR